ncbi:hypothetical protein GCM10011514_40950 [Emticicia aquatilis]|uniref:Cytochrome c domain-containing protein n=1 Tax=Emticicia aquatilis TaxID=1537369 RepID=A0A916Z1U3_9BACT|nr:cytochrome c [Emticicia aquatilis]GGD72655.1 hypothetical protein GCM10011514_40950 [Emticicia aquatilis]
MNNKSILQLTKLIYLIVFSLIIVFGVSLYILLKPSQSIPEAQIVYFCGVIDTNSENSRILDSTQLKGKEIFNQNCVQCHSPTDEVVVGPGLKNISKRKSTKWIINFTKNPQRIIDSGDKYAISLFNKFNKTQMTAFQNLSDEEIKAIIKYLDY